MQVCNEYTKDQWEWIWDRFCEGYTLRELSGFLYLHHETIRRRFQRMGRRPLDRRELPPLSERREEFRALEEPRCL
ncbi:MAG: hypothetical protein PUC45_07365 [Oscillospiraceae bacterium]|nr:hypothetical protein [Oscillospiraceae bacterium]